ncbi:MAG: ferrochelatase [Deltaproteobacteria bacterium]|nr:ferrochelatase [Deltaproteobacteria bacterium]
MNDYLNETDFRHGEIPAVGVLVTNLGTPDEPTAAALRIYLEEFLSDPRVIELPRWKWLPILYLFILTRRPKESAKLYQQVWTEEGSPLLVISRKQAKGLEDRLREQVGSPLHVAVGMRYGNPSIPSGLEELRQKGCRRILVLPLYPQYAAATTGSTFDALAAELSRYRWVPELRTVHNYHDDPGYIGALAQSIREVWQQGGEAEKLLFSFHGIPQRYFDGGDPYHCNCHKTARRVAEELGIGRDRYIVSFQSLFGKEEWIKPYTDVTVKALAQAGVKSLDVICPGFSADCLETLEEIDGENRHYFEEAGGEQFRYIAALNDRPDHLDALSGVALNHLQGWVVGKRDWDPSAAEEGAQESRRQAELVAHLDPLSGKTKEPSP